MAFSPKVREFINRKIEVFLEQNDEVFLTYDQVCDDENILKLLCGTTPDFIIKKKPGRQKTILVVWCREEEKEELMMKYESLSFFSEAVFIPGFDGLKCVLPEMDIGDLRGLYKDAIASLFRVAPNSSRKLFKSALVGFAREVSDQALI